VTTPAKPHFGITLTGHHVHLKTVDHLPRGMTWYQRMNRQVALVLTTKIGSMTCFWVFWALCFTILPSVLHTMGVNNLGAVPRFMLSFGFNLLGTWLFSTCFQLTLLPALMVGQNLQNEAADARAAKTFEDAEKSIKISLLIANKMGVDTSSVTEDVAGEPA
jgi:hypothetical protein